MDEQIMPHIISCNTSAEMWQKLASVYEEKGETSIHIIQQHFFQYKYDECIETATFLPKIFCPRISETTKTGEAISDKLVITKVYMSLPEKYHFVSAWESAPDDK